MSDSQATVQLNVRMDRTLKESGDATLQERRISPSEIVRALWGKLAQRGSVAEEVLQVVLDDDSGDANDSIERVAIAARGTQLFSEGCERLGISASSVTPDQATWKDIREDAISARLGERGVA